MFSGHHVGFSHLALALMRRPTRQRLIGLLASFTRRQSWPSVVPPPDWT